MNIIQICSKPPFPPKDGGTLAMNILTQGLLAIGHRVKVLTISTHKHYVNVADVKPDYVKATDYEAVYVDTTIRPFKALLNLFSTRSYNVERFDSPEFAKALIQILNSEQFDVVQLETLWVAPYLDVIRKHSKAKIVLRSQNVEYLIWERLANNTSNPLKKWYLSLLAKRLKNYELDLLNKYDGIAPITTADMKMFESLGCKVPMLHVPFGIDLQQYTADETAQAFPSAFHIGAMDWRPNEEGIKWLIDEVWPAVLSQAPDLKLYLAGRHMAPWLLNLQAPGITIEGEVPDSKKFILSKSLMLVPLFSGGGMRVKIIEGMALGKTIISTSIGAEGIDYTHNHDIIIADTKEDFVKAIIKCSTDQSFALSLGKNARTLVEKKYDNAVISKGLSDFYEGLKNS